MEIKVTLARFIGEELLSGGRIGYEENLLSDGMIDSLGMLRLVGFIEETYGWQVPPEDFTIENFRTIEVLSHYLQQSLDPMRSTRDVVSDRQ